MPCDVRPLHYSKTFRELPGIQCIFPLHHVNKPGKFQRGIINPHLFTSTRHRVSGIATFLSTTESIASHFSPVIINISKKALFDTNFDLRLLGLCLTKMLHFCNLSSG